MTWLPTARPRDAWRRRIVVGASMVLLDIAAACGPIAPSVYKDRWLIVRDDARHCSPLPKPASGPIAGQVIEELKTQSADVVRDRIRVLQQTPEHPEDPSSPMVCGP
jgi:hypothetical protein